MENDGVDPRHPVIVVMGVSGSGKSVVARLLAASSGLAFIEADELHSPGSVALMSAGVPLNDQDRWPWLTRVGNLARQRAETGPGAVVACSALKRSYRDVLRSAAPNVKFVWLAPSPEEVADRLAKRVGHFMTGDLLKSQLDALEPLDREEARNALIVETAAKPEAVVSLAMERFGLKPTGDSPEQTPVD